MAVTVGTDSYGNETGLAAYATARGITISGDATELLYKAMDWLEYQPFKNEKYDYDQALQFPRLPNQYWEGDTEGEVPDDIVTAQYIAAILIDDGNDLNQVVGRATKREKVDVIEVEYKDSSNDSPYYPQLTRILSRFLASTGGSFIVSRA